MSFNPSTDLTKFNVFFVYAYSRLVLGVLFKERSKKNSDDDVDELMNFEPLYSHIFIK